MGEIADECIHGLTAAWCSLCKQKPRAIRKRESQWGAYEREGASLASSRNHHPSNGLREANFDTSCPWCTNHIGPGDLIANRDNEWICADCVETYDAEMKG